MWIVIAVVLGVAVAAAVVALVPRVRCLATEKARPHLVNIWREVKAIAVEPRKIFYVLGGSLCSQVLIARSPRRVAARGRGARQLHHPHRRADAGRHDRRGGPGAGRGGGDRGRAHRRSDQRRRAAGPGGGRRLDRALLHRHLPPIWGWATLVWMRHSDYV